MPASNPFFASVSFPFSSSSAPLPFSLPCGLSVAICEVKPLLFYTTDADGVATVIKQTVTLKKDVTATAKEFTATMQELFVDGYLVHRHTANYNAAQFSGMVDALAGMPPGHVIMLMDFGMNYSHVHKDGES